MKKQLLDKMCCPFDKGDLEVTVLSQEGDEIIEGLITCPTCLRYYPIIYSIPIMTPDEYRQKSLEMPVLKKWGLSVDPHNPDRFVLENTKPLLEE